MEPTMSDFKTKLLRRPSTKIEIQSQKTTPVLWAYVEKAHAAVGDPFYDVRRRPKFLSLFKQLCPSLRHNLSIFTQFCPSLPPHKLNFYR